MGNSCSWPGPRIIPVGSVMSEGAVTLTEADAEVRPAALAVMMATPGPTPVTGTFTDEEPAGNMTVTGTLATPVLFEARLTLSGAGAAEGSVNTRLTVFVPVTVSVEAVKLSAAPT